MTISNFSKSTLSGNGRAMCPFTNIGAVDIAVKGSLGGGTLAIQASYEDVPGASTDADWVTLAGADSIETGKVHPVQLHNPTKLAVNLIGATAPSLTIIWI